ncbi:hypothetical protein PCC8801_1561 [Rippkaea orientalis PCC 8801]|uniref:Uncharacterized protein n=1 Tax=Rippkaea orientalis (strain PCC 8801 / RF-1) TaxID=41431 RepID=B7JUR9_RIPO1|nr:hypothetical protein [Rippkaea orientalis]ACK65613.1 hypothetical protein PCC8801_1561 [Rippkaea orientalis PCC 8801]
MNNERITKLSLEDWGKMEGKTDWNMVDSMTKEEIEKNAWNDLDNQPLSDEFWEEAEVIFPEENYLVNS